MLLRAWVFGPLRPRTGYRAVATIANGQAAVVFGSRAAGSPPTARPGPGGGGGRGRDGVGDRGEVADSRAPRPRDRHVEDRDAGRRDAEDAFGAGPDVAAEE